MVIGRHEPKQAKHADLKQAVRIGLDACLRATWHVMTHVRQIWLLRGVLGLTDAGGWPEQHWA